MNNTFSINTFSIVVILIVVFLILFLLFFIPVGLWVSALASGAKVSIFSLVGMRLRRVNPSKIINPLIKGTKANLDLSVDQLEAHYLSGGSVDNVVDALIAAQRADLELTFEKAAAIDLAGRDVFDAVKKSVTPTIIETPWVSAVAVDGIEVRVIAKVTVRANLSRLIGGAGDETIIARVGEGIVTTVGSSKTHKEVLENPDRISSVVLNKGLDAGTSYEILSIDIADIDIGRNIGAKLQIDQAEADKLIAQARAEERRSLAVALEQEMRAKVVEAESRVPEAIAEALRNGNIGIMDYLNIENKKADTNLRNSFSNKDINIDVSEKPRKD